MASIIDKMKENKLRWVQNVIRRKKSKTLRTVVEMSYKEKGGIESDVMIAGICVVCR